MINSLAVSMSYPSGRRVTSNDRSSRKPETLSFARRLSIARDAVYP